MQDRSPTSPILTSVVCRHGTIGKKESETLPALTDRTVKFAKGELVTHLWSSAGESSPKQNKTHRENIVKVLDKYAPKKSDRYENTAHLIVKGEQVLVQMHGMIVDELVAESVAKVRDRLSVPSPIPVKCRIEIYSRGRDTERANVVIDHKI